MKRAVRTATHAGRMKMGDERQDSFKQLAMRSLEFVTRMAVDTYPDRRSQRCPPTFALAAGNVLNGVYERGGLRTKDGFSASDLTGLIGNLNIWWMAAELSGKVPVEEYIEDLRGIGYAYHMTDNEISEWQQFVRNCEGSESAFGRLLAHFDRIVEPAATIWGNAVPIRWQNWTMLFADVSTAYHSLMENREWITDLDAALDRVRSG